MQTFVPCLTYEASARVLDRQRLGKQRVEALQILKAIKTGKGWINHPATKMWEEFPLELAQYGIAICTEWISRGYKDTCAGKIIDLLEDSEDIFSNDIELYPSWWNSNIHSSHRSALLFKNYSHYKQFNWEEKPNLRYYWPGR
jgi:hypothetical protein